jgi:hypothetical protein
LGREKAYVAGHKRRQHVHGCCQPCEFYEVDRAGHRRRQVDLALQRCQASVPDRSQDESFTEHEPVILKRVSGPNTGNSVTDGTRENIGATMGRNSAPTLSNVNFVQTPTGRPGGPQRPTGRRLRLGPLLHHGWRHTRRLFHMLVGMVFLLLAAAGATQSFAEWQAYTEKPMNGLWRFEVMTGFSVALLIFGLYSFLKARSVR